MIVNINENKKRVEIWLTQNKSDDPELRNEIKTMIDRYGYNEYLSVIFTSGTGDITEATAALLKLNST